MALQCFVFSNSDQIPNNISLFLNAAPFFEVGGHANNLNALRSHLERHDLHYLLLDLPTMAAQLPDVLSTLPETVKCILFDKDNTWVLEDINAQAMKDLEREAVIAEPAVYSSTVDAHQGSLRLRLPGPLSKLVRQQIAAGREEISIRFGTALSEVSEGARAARSSIFVRSESRILRILLPDLLYVEAQKDYVVLHTRNEEFRVLGSMKHVANELGRDEFFRIHRSYIVRVDKITSIEGEELNVEGLTTPLPIGPSYKSKLIKRLGLI